MKGHILITDKVNFVYHELPKPLLEAFKLNLTIGGKVAEFKQRDWEYAMEAYEASKRTVEVSNKTRAAKNSLRYWLLLPHKAGKIEIWDIVKNNQPCEAEVKNNKATIIELIK